MEEMISKPLMQTTIGNAQKNGDLGG